MPDHLTSAYAGPLTAELPETAFGFERVLARLDTMATLIDESPELMRAIFAIESKLPEAAHAGPPTSLTRSSSCVTTPSRLFR